MPDPFPSLATAAAQATIAISTASRDGLVRVECPLALEIDEFLSAADPETRMRIGLTTPFRGRSLRRRKNVSSNPRLLTKWRNEPIAKRRATKLLILGYASGPEESGLRSLRSVVPEEQILRQYLQLGRKWFKDNVPTHAPARLFRAMVELASQAKLDLVQLSMVSAQVFGTPSRAHTAPQARLWELGLLPDPRAMDGSSSSPRLQLNYSTVEMLRSSPDTTGDVRRVQRLATAADSGDKNAEAALAFRGSGDKRHLKHLELDKVLQLLRPTQRTGPRPETIQLTILEALDEGFEDLPAALDGLGGQWDLEDDSVKEAIDVGDQSVTLDLVREESSLLFPDDRPQVLFSTRLAGSSREDADEEGEGRLREAAQITDLQLGTHSELAEMAEELLTARKALRPLDLWSQGIFELLLLDPSLLEAAQRYKAAWLVITEGVQSHSDPAKSTLLRDVLLRLDADWEYETEPSGTDRFVSATMYITHPFVLAPLILIAEHAKTAVGEKKLGHQVRWAMDRALPAYPAIWVDANSSLVHSGGAVRPRFVRRTTRHRPEASSTAGVIDVVKSFVGLHPYAKTHLSTVFADPPRGSGIPGALRAVERRSEADRISVRVLATDAEGVDWTSLGHRVQHLGRVTDLTKWADTTLARTHIAFIFLPSRRGTAESRVGGFEPSRGLHNYFTVSVRAPASGGKLKVTDEYTPFVSLQPRDSNEIVRRMMELGRASNAEDCSFEIQPMLDKAEEQRIVSLAGLAEWVVVGAPGPMGLIPPRSLGEGTLHYLGREDFGPYSLFVYCRDLYAVLKTVETELTEGPVFPDGTSIEQQLRCLAESVPNGVLRIGRSHGHVTPQIGLMAATHYGTKIANGG